MLTCLWVAAGCGVPVPAAPQGPISTDSTAALVDSNGVDLNGISLNGTVASGSTVTSVDYGGMSLGGTSISEVTLSGTSLVGVVTSDAGIISGPGFKGVQMRAHISNGVVYTAKIDVVLPWQAIAGTSNNGTSLNGTSLNGNSLFGLGRNGGSVNGPGAGGGHRQDPGSFTPSYTAGPPDGYAYVVTLHTPLGDRPLCGNDASGNPIPAIPLAGRWNYARDTVGGGDHIDDPHAFTFGCVGAALAKCVELGYWPWLGADARAHHQACTRMIRADYCGDGTPHTVNGMLINLYDNEGIQSDTENWPFEAEWNADGATCVAHQRIYTHGQVQCATPHTFGNVGTCGDLSHFQSGTLLMDEYSPTDQIR